MDISHCNEQGGSVRVLPLKVATTRVRPGNVSELLKIGCLNVRGAVRRKRDEIESMFEKFKLDILGLSDVKLRGEGELSFGNARGVRSWEFT